MILKNLGQTADKKIQKINKLLSEQFGFTIAGYPERAKLDVLLESAYDSIVTIRGTNKKFHLDPEYIKYLGIKDVIETMISEGMYAEGPAYQEMQDFVKRNVHDLMDSGYSLDDTVNEVMNRYRLDSRFAFPDDHVKELVMQCATDYIESFEVSQSYNMPREDHIMPHTEIMLLPRAFESVARYYGVKSNTTTAHKIVENKIRQFAVATGKDRNTIVEFINKMSRTQFSAGITLFEQKVKQYALNEAKKNYKAQRAQEGKKSYRRKALQKMMEEVDLEQAEVVVAAKGLSSELQSQVEKLGRMLNEDLPAIAEQIRAEMGAQTAVTFKDAVSQVLTAHLEATRQAQQSLEQAVSTITGEEMAVAPAMGSPAEAPAVAPGAEDSDLSGLGAEESPTEEPAVGDEEGLGRAAV